MGVKSLWTLLTPVGRPVMLETVEGKSMAIDSSIWIYQFQATMRDKEGRALSNAHVLGFLRRITKLLFYGIKPVFVFDGGAPALKRATLTERKRKKSGAAASHAKIAEKLLAAKLRREAMNHAEGAQVSRSSKARKGKAPALQPLDENTVYLEDIDGSTPKTPSKRKVVTPSSSAKKNKFHDHDPYKLPELDFEANIAKATRSTAPDPRLATEDELRTFIEEMRPEDFDINSPAFRELPTEIQYEIVGDLRLKSRQTSYARLQKMLKSAPTPLDFSKHQIKNLKQRNALTQQLLMTTDTIGSAHIAIPVRIASERNKEYVLIKNEGEFGGWILGIKDTGTREKPIVIDHEEVKSDKNEDEDSDADMEEVAIPVPPAPDPDLREYQREMALSAISNRTTSKNLRPLTTKKIDRKSKAVPLFDLDDDDELLAEQPVLDYSEVNDDDLVAYAVQESFDQSNFSKSVASTSQDVPTPSAIHPVFPSRDSSPEDDFYMDYPAPTRLESALSIANADGSSRAQLSPSKSASGSILFGKPTMLTGPSKQPQMPASLSSSDNEITIANSKVRNDQTFQFQRPEMGRQIVPEQPASSSIVSMSMEESDDDDDMEEATPEQPTSSSIVPISMEESDGDDDMEEATPEQPTSSSIVPISIEESDDDDDMEEVPVPFTSHNAMHDNPSLVVSPRPDVSPSPSLPLIPPIEEVQDVLPFRGPVIVPLDADLNNDQLFIISRTPSPSHEAQDLRPPSPPIAEDWDAAEEMDVQAEEGEFARFISQVKGKDLSSVRKEIDDEIKALNEQKKIAMRDSEDITQQMVSQIITMLRFFGIPYITAPMEAEAQCAELLTLGLVDGVITDDSDVFLFGAQRVYKNMFNQSKTVECFLFSDLSRELGLDRDKLIQLAYLLGSDYTEGLPGIGPVVAMELLNEFPGHNGLHKFKDWWLKVQSGKDKDEESQSKFRKQFKKKFRDLYLASDWPDSVVRDAYYHPAVDSSEEPFKWGLPDLDGLREFLHHELGWKQTKVDELLLPIIQKMNKRGQAAALNRQNNLNEFLDISAGSGTRAPRRSRAYESKRLQQVISEFRKKNKQRSGSNTPVPESQTGDGNSEDESESVKDVEEGTSRKRQRKTSKSNGESAVKKKGRTTATSSTSRGKGKSSTSSAARGRGRGGSGQTRTRARKSKAQESSSELEEMDEDEDSDVFEPRPAKDVASETGEVNLRPRPKPRPAYKGARDPIVEENGGEASAPNVSTGNVSPNVMPEAT